MTRKILDEFYQKDFPWSARDSVRIWEALDAALYQNDALLAQLAGEDEGEE